MDKMKGVKRIASHLCHFKVQVKRENKKEYQSLL